MSFPILLQDLGMQFATPLSKQKKELDFINVNAEIHLSQ